MRLTRPFLPHGAETPGVSRVRTACWADRGCPVCDPLQSATIRGNHSSNTTCLTHVFFKSGE